MTFTITDDNGTWIGRRIYIEAKFALAVAKRIAKARSKNPEMITSAVYVMADDGVEIVILPHHDF